MIEKTVQDYLKARMKIPVVMEEPKSPPVSYVVIEKTGEGGRDHIGDATIAIQSYAGSLYEASALNEQVKRVMKDIAMLDQISKCQLNASYNFTDPETKRYRYQAVFDIVFYEE